MQLMKLIIIFGSFELDSDPDDPDSNTEFGFKSEFEYEFEYGFEAESGSETFCVQDQDPRQKFRIHNPVISPQNICSCSRPAGRCAAGSKVGAVGTGGVPPRAPPSHPRLSPRPGRRSRGDSHPVCRRPRSCRPHSR